MTDWSHRSAFEDFYLEMNGKGKRPMMTSALMGGRGKSEDPDVLFFLLTSVGSYDCTDTELREGNCTGAPKKYSTTFHEVCFLSYVHVMGE